MKRAWLFLLSLGLIAVFSTSAMAVDVKVSGEFYSAGMYLDRTSFTKDTASDGPSTAFYYQRLRVRTDFVVSKGLTFVTRADIMERAWGAARSAPGTSKDSLSYETRAENENIAFDWAYVEYISPIGLFRVGVFDDGAWGTVFNDTSQPQGMILYGIQLGGWSAGLNIVKVVDNSRAASQTPSFATTSDLDLDKYQVGTVYEWKTGKVGLLGVFYRGANMRQAGLTARAYVLEPFFMINVGPVKIQGELDYAWGEVKNENPGPEFRVDNLAGWIDATVDLQQFHLGGTFAYVAGNDWNNCSFAKGGGVVRGGFLTGGMDWSPTLILFNNERQYWTGDINGHGLTGTFSNDASKMFGLNDTGMYNAWFFQLRAGVRPIDKLDLSASVSYALAENKTLGTMLVGAVGEAQSDVYGTEIDLVGTYKITNNLSYMLGGAYLFTGDYFKGMNSDNKISNNFLILNKLTLTF